jgi:predicted dehydrogenase
VNVGIVGCGVISRHYAKNASGFGSFRLAVCADVDGRAAALLGEERGLPVATVEDLIADASVDIVLNLTPPAAHAAVTLEALAAEKHVYTEKPLATTVEEAHEIVVQAGRRGLRVGSAPDIFLGSAYQAARALIDEGMIGEPLTVSATMLAGGQARWHPNADVFYADGAGPLLDMGPYYLTAIVALLGPVRRVAGFASTRVLERVIEIGPREGERFTASTPTHTAALLELEGGVTGSLVASFESPEQFLGELVVYGAEGTLALPDPNGFDGPVRLRRARGEWQDMRFAANAHQDVRGIGLHDLVESLTNGHPHRASGELAHHVVDVARTILASAEEGRTLEVASRVERPAPRVPSTGATTNGGRPDGREPVAPPTV